MTWAISTPTLKAQSTYEVSEFEVTPPQITYYCVDEIYVGPVREGLEASLEQTGKYTFRSVHFPSASAELQAEALPELKELAAYLQKHPGKKAEIAGHTDDVGQAADNQQLSEARAKAVRDYLDQPRGCFRPFDVSGLRGAKAYCF